MFDVIVATDINYGISKNNKIPWYIPEDLKHFSSITTNHILIMGSNTALDLKKPLKNRINIVISNNEEKISKLKEADFIIKNNLEDALKYAEEIQDKVIGQRIFIVGGRDIFNKCIKSELCDTVYHTYIDYDYQCDNFLDKDIYEKLREFKVINSIDKKIEIDQEKQIYDTYKVVFFRIKNN